MNKIAVVVLHYETVEDTAECLSSLCKQNYQNFDVIVVDNGSVNGKIGELKDQYRDKGNFYFINSEKNLGFAKGNNLGFNYAKQELKSDIIILANNDLVFKQRDFLSRINKAKEEIGFDVAGPRIISLIDGMNQNPVARTYKTEKDVNIRLCKLYTLYAASYIDADLVIKKFISKPIVEFQYCGGSNFQLHGACLIFSNQFIHKHDGLYPGTFMYGEEDILRWQIESENLKMAYLTEAAVYHKEGSSTNSVYKKDRMRRQFSYKYSIESIKVLKSLIKTEGNY